MGQNTAIFKRDFNAEILEIKNQFQLQQVHSDRQIQELRALIQNRPVQSPCTHPQEILELQLKIQGIENQFVTSAHAQASQRELRTALERIAYLEHTVTQLPQANLVFQAIKGISDRQDKIEAFPFLNLREVPLSPSLAGRLGILEGDLSTFR